MVEQTTSLGWFSNIITGRDLAMKQFQNSVHWGQILLMINQKSDNDYENTMHINKDTLEKLKKTTCQCWSQIHTTYCMGSMIFQTTLTLFTFIQLTHLCTNVVLVNYLTLQITTKDYECLQAVMGAISSDLFVNITFNPT